MKDFLDTLDEEDLPHYELTKVILGCCFEVMKELGAGLQKLPFAGTARKRAAGGNRKTV